MSNFQTTNYRYTTTHHKPEARSPPIVTTTVAGHRPSPPSHVATTTVDIEITTNTAANHSPSSTKHAPWYISQICLESGANFLIPSPITTSNELVTVWDPEVGKINPSEHKQLKLARSLTCGIIDRDLKPRSSERKSIQRILKYPPTRILSGDERQLLWKFCFSLMSEKRALTKFLRCVEWSDVQ
ncbi:hypothetical protein ACSBR2_030035 [Camellia fascicularis]